MAWFSLQSPVQGLTAAQGFEIGVAERHGFGQGPGFAVTLHREPWTLPETVPFGDADLKPLRGGETLNWRLQ